jgi:hypothetical protein
MYKIVAFVAVVLAGVFVAPVAASAVPYTPGAQIVASRIHLIPNQTTRITADTGFFGGGQSVHVAISGTAASDWSTPAVTSSASGGATFTLRAPKSSTGRYTVTLTSTSASGSVVLTVTPKGQTTDNGSLSSPTGGTSTSGGTGTSSSGLATTGGSLGNGNGSVSNGTTSTITGESVNTVDIQMIVVWALIALLGLVLAFIIVTRIRHKEQTTA